MVTNRDVIAFRAKLELERRRRQKRSNARDLFKRDYKEWLQLIFPNTFVGTLAPYHEQFWEWLWGLRPGQSTNPFVAIWPRGFSKTTNAEIAMVYAAARGYKYALYVKSTQSQADDAVSNIAQRLESPMIEQYYPSLADRQVNKYGASKGWRRNRLMTRSGFAVDALGLDTAKRGAKLNDSRPDFLVIDDVDAKHDTVAATEKKIASITSSLIPALNPESVVLVVQNLVTPHGIVSRLAGVQPEGIPEADFLSNRVVSGPHPALEGFEYEMSEQDGKRYWRITSGEPTWEYMTVERLEYQLNRMGPTSFIDEVQNEVQDLDGGLFDKSLFRHINFSDLPELEDVNIWVDPAVTSTNKSDNQGVIADGRDAEGNLYRLYSWEGIESPTAVLRRVALKALDLKASTVGIEANQGGELWTPSFNTAWKDLVEEGLIPEDAPRPYVIEEKVTIADGPKRARWQKMLMEGYERGTIYHVMGTHEVLERSLRRLPIHKPYDLADTAYLSWFNLISQPMSSTYTRSRAKRTR